MKQNKNNRLAGVGIQPELADGQVAVAVGILGRGGLGGIAHLDICKLDGISIIHGSSSACSGFKSLLGGLVALMEQHIVGGSVLLVVLGCFGLHDLIQQVRLQGLVAVFQHRQAHLAIFAGGDGAVFAAAPVLPILGLQVILPDGKLCPRQCHAGVIVHLVEQELSGGGRGGRCIGKLDGIRLGGVPIAQLDGVVHVVIRGSTALLYITLVHQDHGGLVGDLHVEPAILICRQHPVQAAENRAVG